MSRVLFVLAALSIAPWVWADTVSLSAVADNTLYANGDDLSDGAGQFLFAGIAGDNTARRGVMRFDVAASVPAGATITGATLTLHMSKTNGGASNVSLHTLQASWGEAGSVGGMGEGGGGPAQTGDATWKYRYYPTETWSTIGGDFNALSSASTNVSGIANYSWSSAQLAADVQGWLNVPAGNFGWLLLGDESGALSAKRFDSRQNADPGVRPVLTVTYVPEPGALASIATIAGVAGIRRRCR